MPVGVRAVNFCIPRQVAYGAGCHSGISKITTTHATIRINNP